MLNNPFEKRAGEYFRNEDAFLSIVSPQPVTIYLKPHADNDRLYDRLVLMRGAPGSGKTTIAQLFEYQRIATLQRHAANAAYKPLIAALAECQVIVDGEPAILGCRLALESGYRDIWQFPYAPELKTGLLTTLVQARAVLSWLRNLEAGGVPADAVTVVPRDGHAAATDAIGGTAGPALLARAREVEGELYRISSALVPPRVDVLERSAIGSYRPFDVIDRVLIARAAADRARVRRPASTAGRARAGTRVAIPAGGDVAAVVGPSAAGVSEQESASDAAPLSLRPLVVLDDAQTLHPAQFEALQAWLARREPRVARWVLSWLDVVSPEEAFRAGREAGLDRPDQPGIASDRDVTRVFLQSGYTERKKERAAFRKTAKDMASRYLVQTPGLAERGFKRFEDLLSTGVAGIGRTGQAELARDVSRDQQRFGITDARRSTLESTVATYLDRKSVV